MTLLPLPDPLTFRPYGEDEFAAVYAVIARAFLDDPTDETARAGEAGVMEWDRTWGVWDGDLAVGSIAVFSHEMALPGGVRPVAGVSMVAVAGTHTRRGILRHMLTTVLTDLHASGESVAALWATDPAIYGRFGFGVASRALKGSVPTRAAFLPGTPAPDGRLELLELTSEESLERLGAVHERLRRTRIGDFARDIRWWRHRAWDPAAQRGGSSPLFAVVHSTDGLDDGYALASTKSEWGEIGAAGRVGVREVVAADPTAELSLWRYLLDTDLAAAVDLRVLATDSPLVSVLTNLRGASFGLVDNLHVRIVDVPRALAERSYATDVDLVIEVDDPVLDANTGRWRVRPGSCVRTEDAPDLTVGVRELGSVHLGAVRWGEMARAGLVQEHAAGAVVAADAAWALPGDLRAPLCPMVF